jgi:probable phosphoglycerate mutase
MKLYFIRHGQTDWNAQRKIQGSCDIELNNTGVMQAKELGNKLLANNYKFSKIYSSQQKRAIQTAETLSRVTSIEYESIAGLEEINLGVWEGLSWDEVQERYPSEYEVWSTKRRYMKPPEGETYDEMLQRALTAIHKIIQENCDNVLIVSHSAVIAAIQCYLTNTPFEDLLKFITGNAEITEIEANAFEQRTI